MSKTIILERKKLEHSNGWFEQNETRDEMCSLIKPEIGSNMVYP